MMVLQMMWSAMRASSITITRMYSTRLGSSMPQQLLHRHVPTHVVDGCTAVVHPVRQRGDLVERTAFGDLLEGPVDVPDGLLGIQDDLPVQGEHVLEDAVRGRVRGAEVQRGELAEVLALNQVLLPEIRSAGLLHRPKKASFLSWRVGSSRG
jgi:hypothetical protein